MWTGVALTSMFPACPPGATPSSCSSRVQLWPVCDPGPEEDPGLLATSLLLIATVFLINPLLTADPLKFLGTLMKTKQPSSNKVWRKGGGDALRCGSDASKLCSPKQVLLPVTAFFPSPKSLLRGQHPVFQLWIHHEILRFRWVGPSSGSNYPNPTGTSRTSIPGDGSGL